MTLASERFFEKYNKLPKDVQRAMFSSLTSDRIFEIGAKHGLAIDKMGLLSEEIGWVLLGEKRASRFVENLQKALGLSHEKAYEVAQDVNHSIFFEIRENLKQLHGVPTTDALIAEKPLAIPADKAGINPLQVTTGTPPIPPRPAAASAAPPQQTHATPPASLSTAEFTKVEKNFHGEPVVKRISPSGTTYWEALSGLKDTAPEPRPAPKGPLAVAPTELPKDLRVNPIAPLPKERGISQDANFQPPSPSSLKAEVSLSNGVNHEIEENEKGSLAQIKHREEEKALRGAAHPRPRPAEHGIIPNQASLEKEVGAILGNGAAKPSGPKDAAPYTSAARPAPPTPETKRPAPPPPSSLPVETASANPGGTTISPAPAAPKSPPPKSYDKDPYREPIENR